MGLNDATEKRHAYARYVKRNLGLWSGRDVLPWYVRLPLAPFYGLYLTYLCVKGVPMNFQVLHERDYEPEDDGLLRCPQCRQPTQREITLKFSVGEGEEP